MSSDRIEMYLEVVSTFDVMLCSVTSLGVSSTATVLFSESSVFPLTKDKSLFVSLFKLGRSEENKCFLSQISGNYCADMNVKHCRCSHMDTGWPKMCSV